MRNKNLTIGTRVKWERTDSDSELVGNLIGSVGVILGKTKGANDDEPMYNVIYGDLTVAIRADELGVVHDGE